MNMIRFQDVAAVVLTLAFASPPLWWAGEALGAARQIARNEIERPADEKPALVEWAKLLKP
jgi:hypothetical protein